MNSLAHALGRLKDAAQAADTIRTDGAGMVVLFFSCTDGSDRAIVRTAAARTFEAAWTFGARQIRAAIENDPKMARWLRIDWVDAVRPITWRELGEQLPLVKRNYFRLGVSLDSGFSHAFLETELNANAMFYMGAAQAGAGINTANFSRYAKARHGVDIVDFPPDARIWLFTTRALFAGEDGIIHHIDGAGPNAGVREQGAATPDAILGMIRSGSAYLAAQVADDGRFRYGWHPCFDREIGTYNSLRHASSLFAMIEAWEAAPPDDDLRAAIERSIGYLVDTFVKRTRLDDGQDAAWLIDEGDEIKLGGLAACVLALTRYEQVFGVRRYAPLLDALGAAILSMQDSRTGRFDHVLSYPSLRLKQRFRIVYYDGEAVFALLRLYRATGNERWLDAASRAMDHFIEEERWRTHDHWLAYCVDEITQIRPLERYFRLGLQNVADYLDFIEHRITAFPTLLELACATERVIRRLRGLPDLRHILDTFDIDRFRDAMHGRARHLANGHFWPELAMFYARPERIVGSFFIRHHAFRVRIDDVEHFLSGLIAYRDLCRHPVETVPEQQSGAGQWLPRRVAQATGGLWVRPPPAGWSADGLCIFAPSFRPDDLIVARGDGKFGISAAQEAALPSPPAAVIADDATTRSDIPLLQVPDLPKAVLDMGHFARSRFAGAVIGVTGSAGKTTTVAMLAHALRPWGVAQTRFNANLPAGVAWNLASIDWTTPHIVLEMAIGRMRQNAQLARPDIAVFTNILPAHLEYHRDIRTIADRKSRIFEGMRPGGTAILNREMVHLDDVRLAARARGLTVLTYGESGDADVRLLSYDQQTGQVSARLAGRTIDYALRAPGRHMAINSLAVLGVAAALGRDPEAMLPQLTGFAPLPGRGDVHDLKINGGRLTVLNDAYNANPGSMAASIELFGKMTAGGRKIAVLGEMLELGENASRYHAELAPLIERSGIDRVHMLGDLYRECWDRLVERRRGIFAQSLDELKTDLRADLRDRDLLMIKGSHGSRLHTLLGWLSGAEDQS